MTINVTARTAQTRQVRTGMELALGSVARPNPLVIAWRWRYELGGAFGLAIAIYALTLAVGPWWALVVIATTVGALGAWREGRRQAVMRAWCIITPHRVRTGCAQAWIHSRQGKIPIVLFTSAQPYGERVYLWLRAGVGVGDLIAVRPLLAAACWAQDVYVARHDRYAHLIVLDVIRRSFPHPSGGDLFEIERPPSWPQAGITRRGLAGSSCQYDPPGQQARSKASIPVDLSLCLTPTRQPDYRNVISHIVDQHYWQPRPMQVRLRVPRTEHVRLSTR